jgi:hypothetical protein
MLVTYRALIIDVKLDFDFNVGLGLYTFVFSTLSWNNLIVRSFNRKCLCPWIHCWVYDLPSNSPAHAFFMNQINV